MDIKVYSRLAVLEEKMETQEEAVTKLDQSVNHLILTIENSKGSLKMLGWIIGGCTTLGTLINWGISLWHKS